MEARQAHVFLLDALERKNRNSVPGFGSPETLRAASATPWHKGADRLYFFNCYLRDEMPLLDEFADRASASEIPFARSRRETS